MSEREVYIRDQLVLRLDVGLVRFIRQAKVLLDQATAGVIYTDASGQRKRLDLAGHSVSYSPAADSVSVSVANEEMELTWRIFPGEETHIRLEVKNLGPRAVRVAELCVLDVDARRGGSLGFASPVENWRLYQHGWQSWTPTFARRVANGIWVDPNTADYRTKHQPHALPQARKVLSSEWFTVLVPEEKDGTTRSASPDPALLLGFTSTADQLAEIRLEVQEAFQSLSATCYTDDCLLSPGEKLFSETLLLTADDNPLALMDLYAMRLGETMRARVETPQPVETPRRGVSGWCTWYYFFGEETAGDVLANLTWIEKERLPLDVILIDDGYQANIGDWLDVDKAKYPQGMKQVADEITSAGHRPGIWTAPFAASALSQLYKNHPDWILRNEKGEPVVAWQHWGTNIYALDLSLPAAQAWLRDTFCTLSEEWGFQFFKVDFLFAAALPGVRHDPKMTRAQAVRRGLEIIRAAIGNKFLLGCGAPLGPAVGIVDAMRIGPDVHVDWKPYWQDLSAPSAANAILNAIARSFMHGKLWLNDPDCLVLRPRGEDSNLVLNEMRTLTTIVGLTGGLVIHSDNLPSAMRRGRLEYLRRVLPPYGHSAIPLDLFQHELPRLLVLPIETSWDSWMVVALLNWDDHSCVTKLSLSRLGLPPGAYHVYNYWRQRYLGVVHDEITITPHQPHESVLLLIKPVSDQPQLLSSTFHMLQGAVEIKEARLSQGKFLVAMEKPGKQFGQLLFAVPPEYHVTRAIINGRRQRPRQISPGIWQLGFLLRDKAIVELLL